MPCRPHQPRDAALYMPTDDVTTEEGNLKPPPPTVCHLGPIKRQSRETLSMMESVPIGERSVLLARTRHLNIEIQQSLTLQVKLMYSMLGPPFGVLTGVQYMSTTAQQGNIHNILQSRRSLPIPILPTSVGRSAVLPMLVFKYGLWKALKSPRVVERLLVKLRIAVS